MFLNSTEGRIVIASLIEELGLSGLTKEQKDKFADLYEKLVDAEMKLTLASELTEEEVKSLEGMKDPEEIATYLNNKLGVNLMLVMTGAMQSVKSKLISDVSYVKAKLDDKE
jgi:hypothetical protein